MLRLLSCLLALLLTACSAKPPAPASIDGPFLWGVAVAGHQVEGGDRTSQWAAWWGSGKTEHRNERATDSWTRYPEDLDLAKGMGLNAYRFSLEWCRIEPTEGQFDPNAVEHYRKVIRACRARGLEPIVTVMHFAYPSWLDAKGGWENPEVLKAWRRYVEKVAETLGSEVRYWITINEPTVLAFKGYVEGSFPPGRKDPAALLPVVKNLMLAHCEAYDLLHANNPKAMVSFNNLASTFKWGEASTPANAHLPKAKKWLDGYSWQFDLPLLSWLAPELKKKVDYAALDYYFPVNLLNLSVGDPWTWRVYPEGFYQAIRDYYLFFGKPVLVAENGMATRDGERRPDGWTRPAHLVAHIQAMMKAKSEGIPILGYCYWSLLDNYEWGSFQPRFGLYSVDYTKPSLPRIPTETVEIYRDIATHNTVRPAILERALYSRTHNPAPSMEAKP